MKNELIELLREWVELNKVSCRYDSHHNCQIHCVQMNSIIERTRTAITRRMDALADSPVSKVDVVTFCNLLIDADKCLDFIKEAMKEP